MNYEKTIFKIFFLFVLFFGVFGLAKSSWAACSWSGNIGNSSSCTVTEVGQCISDASGKTGKVTINLPACSVVWNSTLSIDMTSGFTNVTELSLIGNGNIASSGAGSAGNTVINSDDNITAAIRVTGSNSKKFRISNIKLSGAFTGYEGALALVGSTKPSSGGGFRIDHVDFYTMRYYESGKGSAKAIEIEGQLYGVIDHNYFYHKGLIIGVQEDSYSNAAWNRPVTFDAENVYVENNVSVQHPDSATPANNMFCDTGNGARVVVRYNQLTNNYLGGHDGSTTYRGGFSYIAYNNNITNTISWSNPRFFLRGGLHIIYNNNITSTVPMSYGNTGIHLWNARSADSLITGTPYLYTDHCDENRFKVCTGPLHSITYANTASVCTVDGAGGQVCVTDSCNLDADCGGEAGACQYLDGDGPDGYPCRDQIGVSYVNGNQQANYPSLFWNNTLNGAPTSPTSISHIQNNRDYCTHATTMPSTCNGKATAYREYIYPHPFVSGSSSNVAPAAPAGVRVI